MFNKPPTPVNPISLPVVSADRNRWFAMSLVLAIISLVFAIDNISLRKDRSDMDIVWVRVYPNGEWQVDFNDLPNRPEFFESTVDAVLFRYVKVRYGINPLTIRSDYGLAVEFMSPLMARDFMSETSFNAVKRANDVIKCGANCSPTYIENPVTEHVEKSRSSFDNKKIYRSSIYVDEVTKARTGGEDEVLKTIITLQWRIMSKQEIMDKYPDTKNATKMLEYLRANPVQIEVVSAERFLDPTMKKSTTISNEAKTK